MAVLPGNGVCKICYSWQRHANSGISFTIRLGPKSGSLAPGHPPINSAHGRPFQSTPILRPWHKPSRSAIQTGAPPSPIKRNTDLVGTRLSPRARITFTRASVISNGQPLHSAAAAQLGTLGPPPPDQPWPPSQTGRTNHSPAPNMTAYRQARPKKRVNFIGSNQLLAVPMRQSLLQPSGQKYSPCEKADQPWPG